MLNRKIYKGEEKMRDKGIWKILAILTALVLIGSCAAMPSAGSVSEGGVNSSSSATIYVPDDCPTIQEAVDAASPGNTIIVKDGTYTENIKVNKSLTIRSENGSDFTIIRSATSDMWGHVFEIDEADHVTISGFTVEGATGTFAAGILVISHHVGEGGHCIIENNIFSNNSYAIDIRWADNNTIANNLVGLSNHISISSNSNTISNNELNGSYIDLFGSNNNVISGNVISGEARYGINVAYSFSNIISDNIIKDHKGFGGISLGCGDNLISNNTFEGCGLVVDSANNTVENCIVNGKPLIYHENESGLEIAATDAGQIILVRCQNMVVKDFYLSNTDRGIHLYETSDSLVEGNILQNNKEGIHLRKSTNNTIKNNICKCNDYYSGVMYSSITVRDSQYNTVQDNDICDNFKGISLRSCSHNIIQDNSIHDNDYGIHVDYSIIINGVPVKTKNNSILRNDISDNKKCGISLSYSLDNNIYLNNFNNANNTYSSSSSADIWNSPEEITYAYNGKTYTNYLGNYWSNYSGIDANKDGIGDTPYTINLFLEGGKLKSHKDNYPLMQPFENYFPEENKAIETKNPKLAFSSYYQPINISVNLSVPPYQLPLNLSNISNIENITAKLKLNEREKELLRTNGFVIIDYGNEDDIVAPYKSMKERGIPIFVTTDTLLHLYHIQFNEILKGIEEREFFDKLVDMSNAMLKQSIQDYENFTDPEMKEAARRNVAYFAVALKLLQTPTEGYNSSEDIKEVNFTVPDYVKEDVEKEIENIEKHDGFHPSYIFNSDPNRDCEDECCYCEDYSQYIPRGHYT
ncbi:DUF3160 domain-containing protein, partial [Methanophagales archaeon]